MATTLSETIGGSEEDSDMHRIKVTTPRYQQSRPYAGQVGEVIGHWGPESNEHGRDGYLVQFPDGNVVGIAEDEVETVTSE